MHRIAQSCCFVATLYLSIPVLAAVVQSIPNLLAGVHTLPAASPSQTPELLLNPSLANSKSNFTASTTSSFSRYHWALLLHPPYPICLANTANQSLQVSPPDPLVIELPGTHLSLSFSRYSRKIPPTDALTTLLQVALTINQKLLAAHGDVPIGIDTEFHIGHAFLIIYGRQEPLTYGHLSAVVRGMASFAQEYGWAGYGMEVFNDGGPRSKVMGMALFSYV
ncbi:MAG: hypothetical protein HETSPECPRED_007083 [Heterodermia speciosa]|uniref:Uncharacterized protein n=1 Tax=Heterodermia speciosa TaxID=116794 RepID=A0A8H3EMP4_9LECA|nr:MAG: hypothetical protein HETSPECPRED_007083 [Heterodermia speciosa]